MKDDEKTREQLVHSLEELRSQNAALKKSITGSITEQKLTTAMLMKSERDLRMMIAKNVDGLIIVDVDGILRFMNPAAESLFGDSAEKLIGKPIGLPMLSGEADEMDVCAKDGTQRTVEMRTASITWEEKEAFLVSLRDITERKKSAEKVHRLSYYDSLTGLPNRIFHQELIKSSIEHARRHQEIFAMIYIGLDNFQRINDTLGHSIGDLLLQAVAGRLANTMRKNDRGAGSAEGDSVKVISRVGGDEFIVVAHDLNQAQDAAETTQRLLQELSVPYDLNGREVFITVSIGIALYPDDGTDVDDLLKNAEKAMRYTKSEGKNNYHIYSSSMHSFVLEHLTLENDLHRALERNELVLYYQPKVDAATRMVKGMEALIRWNHPDKGMISPMQFIPMAESSGLILPIGEFVIRTVCKQIKTWQDAGCKQINIAVNVSGHQFEKQNLIEIITAALQDTMISPQFLDVEITEGIIMRNPEKAIQILTEIKAMGLRIAIDDFGTGYSSLSYLKRLPLDFLKIDQSFIKGVASDSRDQAIVRTTIAMAHNLNLQTIAEGVETEEQLSFLQEHGCDEIQGYLFSRPVPAEEIPVILAKEYL